MTDLLYNEACLCSQFLACGWWGSKQDISLNVAMYLYDCVPFLDSSSQKQARSRPAKAPDCLGTLTPMAQIGCLGYSRRCSAPRHSSDWPRESRGWPAFGASSFPALALGSYVLMLVSRRNLSKRDSSDNLRSVPDVDCVTTASSYKEAVHFVDVFPGRQYASVRLPSSAYLLSTLTTVVGHTRTRSTCFIGGLRGHRGTQSALSFRSPKFCPPHPPCLRSRAGGRLC